jgi:GTPase
VFIDEAKIYLRSGDGGDGLVSFRREKYVPRGGPNGGDGGRGGDVIFRVNPHLNTLTTFRRQSHFKASPGGRGGSSNKTGANGAAVVIEVPPGTIIREAETGRMLAELLDSGEDKVLLRGGRGGKGNAHFMTSSNRAPRVAERGAPGDEMWVTLELKLIADVGLVGVPNAGKSTLLAAVSNATPRIADYPFTTLEPNLGTVVLGNDTLVFADIPGLIEGAHAGVGLGHAFLRHIMRTRLLIHLLDGTGADPVADFSQINAELALFDPGLVNKPQIVVLTKMDQESAQERWPGVETQLRGLGVEAPLAVSAWTREGLEALVQRAFAEYAHIHPVEVEEVPVERYAIGEEESLFQIEVTDEGVFVVTGDRIVRAADMTYWDYEEAVIRFQQILEVTGVTQALEAAGVKVGDTVVIGRHELEWTE